MSNEVTQQNNLASNALSYGLMPGLTAFGSTTIALKTHGKNVLKSQNHKGFKALNDSMKNAGVDVFSRSQAIARAYDDGYKGIAKEAAKANKKLAKLNNLKAKGKLPLTERIKNIFRGNNKVTIDDLIKNTNNTINGVNGNIGTAKKLINADAALANGAKFNSASAKQLDTVFDGSRAGFENLAKEAAQRSAKKAAGEAVESGFKASVKGFGKNVKSNFVKELGWKNGKLNYFMTALQFIPNFINEVIPTFKEKGFGAGIKETGKTLIRMGADLVGYATGGAIGRALGAVVGNIICPGVGAKIGATMGDLICTMFVGTKVTSTVDKALGIKEDSAEVVEANASEQVAQQKPQQTMQEISSNQAVAQENSQAQSNIQPLTSDTVNFSAKYANMPSRQQIKQMAYAQAFPQNSNRHSMLNSYYA